VPLVSFQRKTWFAETRPSAMIDSPRMQLINGYKQQNLKMYVVYLSIWLLCFDGCY